MYSSGQFSRSVTSDSLRPHGLQHAGPPCPSPTPGVYSNSCLLSWWCHPTNSFSVVPLLLSPSIFSSIRVFSNESVLHNRWPKYWSFSFRISPSNEYSGLISFRLDLLAVQETLKSFLQHHSSKASILQCSAFFIVELTSIHQFSSVAPSCPTLCNPMNRSTPGLPIHHHLPEFTQTHVHWVSDAIQPSHPWSSPSPPAPNLPQHHSLFQLVSSSHEVAKVLEFQTQHQSFQWTPRTGFL